MTLNLLLSFIMNNLEKLVDEYHAWAASPIPKTSEELQFISLMAKLDHIALENQKIIHAKNQRK